MAWKRNPASAAPSRCPTKAAVVVAGLCLLLLANPAQGWSQAGGDPQHSGLASLSERPLDIVSNAMLAPGLTLAADGDAGVLTTPAGIVTLGRDPAGTCHLVTVALDHAAASELGSFPCPNGGRLVGYDETGQRLLVCAAGAATDPVLRAYSLAGAKLWAVPPNLQDGVPAIPVPGAPSADTWDCQGVAIDSQTGLAYVPFSSTSGRNRVESVHLADGTTAWAASIPATAFTGTNTTAVPPQLLEVAGGFVAESATLTATGLVVAGHRTANAATGAPPGIAWLGLDGTLVGAASPAPATTGSQAATFQPASRHPAASKDRAAQLMGDALYIINPQSRQVAQIPVGTASLGTATLAAACWSRDVILVPTEGSALLLSTSDPNQPAKRWGGLAQGNVQAVVLGSRNAWVAATVDDVNGTQGYLLRFGLLSVRTEARLPLPFHPTGTLHITPLANDRLLAWDDAGHAALVQPGTTGTLPQLTADSLYPGVGEPARIDVAAPEGTPVPANASLLVAWGDGLIETVHDGDAPSHAYETAGDRQVLLTYVAPNGTTATSALRLHVGSSPPRAVGLIEQAFAPQNQNYTFFGIGLLLTVGGSVFAAVSLHRGRHRLDRHMAALDRLRDQGRREPFRAVRDLHTFREARRTDLAKGDLEDAQYTIIEAGATQVLGLLRQRILGVFTGRVSDRFSGALDLALADGSIDDVEGRGLLAQAEREADLTAAEREQLSGLIRSWQRVMSA